MRKNIQESLVELKQEINDLREDYYAFKKQQHDLEDKIDMTSTCDKSDHESIDDIEKWINITKNNLDEYKQKLVSKEENLTDLQNQLDKKLIEIKNAEAEVLKVEKLPETYQKCVSHGINYHTCTVIANEANIENKNRAKDKLQDLEEATQELQNSISDLNKEISEINNKQFTSLETIKQAYETLLSDKNNQKVQLEQAVENSFADGFNLEIEENNNLDDKIEVHLEYEVDYVEEQTAQVKQDETLTYEDEYEMENIKVLGDVHDIYNMG